MSEDRFTSSLSESLLTLIAFVNNDKAKLVANQVTPELFEGTIYRDIATRILMYWKQFGKAPGTAHIDDIFDNVLNDPNNRLAKNYQQLLRGMYEQVDQLNVDFVFSRVSNFIRQQTLKLGVLQAAQRYQQGGDNVVDDVERILLDTVKTKMDIEDPGVFLNDRVRALKFLDRDDNEYCPLGVQELDYRGICPTRKELFLFIGPRKAGKSWFCVNVGKQGLIHRWKVCHISLELSEERVIQRYFQSFFGIPKRDDAFYNTFFEFDDLKRLIGFGVEKVSPKLSLSDPKVRKYLIEKMNEWGIRLGNILVKQFPSGSLTIPKLLSYLDSIEIVHRFVPDILIVDYTALMKIDPREYTRSLGQVLVDLRGIAVERNIAVVTPAQGNRDTERASRTESSQIAGDISMVATADSVVTYSRTDQEKELNLARLYVSNVRNDEDRFTVVITQNYRTGQFVLQSTPMISSYWDVVKEKTGAEEISE